ncbi:ELWxxDGT repeat protein [Hyalangium versicolor]|uniref:ELWxxDGT repeat protein n=1 Tax=Hyalangium versicolor TaxID=2861190 RepID=UPI001CCE3C71|nr:ELWxxDGT repeat protein [Hyalangium versicolor]
MRGWRGMGWVCSLALVGCGGALSDEGLQEDERSVLSAPAEPLGEEPPELAGRPRLGTAHLVKDLFPPVSGPPWWGPYPESLVAFRGRLFFAANFEDGRGELWRSDGSPAGTRAVKTFPPAPGTTFPSQLSELTPLGSRLFFVVDDVEHGSELWVSDGTSSGTRLVKDIVSGAEGSAPYNLKAVGNILVFLRYIPETPTAPSRTELWRSDGTAAGTVLVKDLGSDTSLSFVQAVVRSTLFFVLSDPSHGTELWKTDGTPAGTMLVKDIAPGAESSYPFGLKALGRYLFFTAADPDHGTALWRSDGTATGTVLVADLTPGSDSGFLQILEPVGSSLFLAMAEPTNGSMRLFRVKNAASGGTQVSLVATLPNPYSDPDSSTFVTTSVGAGGKLFLALGVYGSGPAPRDVQLWVTDGTGSGTKMLHHPLSLSDEFGSTLFALDDRILFSGWNDSTGLELWVSRGSVGNTRMLQDIAQPGSSFPQSFIRVGSSVFFVANDTVHGNELWRLPLLP